MAKSALHEIASLRVRLAAVGLALGALVPLTGWTEGAVRVVDCRAIKTCDALGACEPASTRVAFRLAPVEIAADGSGRYTVSYGDTTSTAQAQSDAGPFYWTVGDERNTLIASSDSEFLWHRLALEPSPHATATFLSCTFGR